MHVHEIPLVDNMINYKSDFGGWGAVKIKLQMTIYMYLSSFATHFFV